MDAHTQGRLAFHTDGDANRFTMVNEQGRWVASLLLNGEQVTTRQVANMERMVACWNACEGLTMAQINSLALGAKETDT